MAADLTRPEGADRSRPSLETTKGEDGSELRSHLTEILYGLENLRGWWPNGKVAARDAWLDHITRHARRAAALPSSSVSPSLTETGMGTGCERHVGDPHNLCPKCWELEPETGMGSGQEPAPDGKENAHG